MIYQKFITSILKDASQIANEKFGKVTGITKGDDNNQVLTEADIAIGKLIIEKLQNEYPDYNIIDEEAGVIDKKSEFTWVVDPIDGTSNFANAVPTYGIMVGLLKGNLPIAGGFSLPGTNEIGYAEKGSGAFINGERVFVTTEEQLSNCLIAYHIDGHVDDPERTKKEALLFGEIIMRVRNMRNTGCEPWDALLVANGKYGALVNQTMKIWDIIVPQIIIEEAGGLCTDFYGKYINYIHPLSKAKDNFTVCAAAPVLHKQLQSIIHNR